MWEDEGAAGQAETGQAGAGEAGTGQAGAGEAGTGQAGAGEAGAPRVPGWEPVRRLGEGSQAEVWLVRDPSGAEAALKLPRVGGAPDSLTAEAAALAHVRHPHLLSPLGTVQTDRGTGVLSEHRPAGTVADLVRAAGPLSPGQAVTVLVPVAQALAHLHQHGIVHGDVSPANVLFGVDGRPALADLGVARVVGGSQGLGGTPGFASPEAVRALEGHAEGHDDGPGPGAEADVFSWGALGWFMLTGRAPGAEGHRAPLPVLVPEVPVELALLLDAGLDPDPAGRPTAAEAASAAYAAAAPEPVPLHEAAPLEVAHLLPTLLPGGAGAATRRGRRGARGSRGSRSTRGAWGPNGSRGAWGGQGARGAHADGPRRRRAPLVAAGALALAAGVTVVGALVLRPAAEARPEAGTGEASAAAQATPSPAPTSPAPTSPAPTSPAPATAALGDVEGGEPGSPRGSEAGAQALASDAAAVAQALEGVARARTAALADPRPELLAAYAVPQGPAWQTDAGVQQDLTEGGFTFAGLTVSLTPDGVAQAAGEEVRVPALLTTSAHAVEDAAGAVVERVAERVDAVTLTLRPGETGWRVERVDAR